MLLLRLLAVVGFPHSEQLVQRHAHKQLAPYVRKAEHGAAAPVRYGMDRAQTCDFRESARRQREAFGVDAEYQHRHSGLLRRSFTLSRLLGPMRYVVGRRLAIEKMRGRLRVDRAIAAMDVLHELLARGVPSHADRVPAILD